MAKRKKNLHRNRSQLKQKKKLKNKIISSPMELYIKKDSKDLLRSKYINNRFHFIVEIFS